MDYIILIKKSKILIIFKIIQNKHIFEIFNFFILFMNKANKDNKHLKDEGYKERRRAFLTREPRESEVLKEQFEAFCAEGMHGEMSRFYYSVNERDPHKTYKELLCRRSRSS